SRGSARARRRRRAPGPRRAALRRPRTAPPASAPLPAAESSRRSRRLVEPRRSSPGPAACRGCAGRGRNRARAGAPCDEPPTVTSESAPRLHRGWDIYEIALRDDPHAALRELRETDPVHDAGNGVFLITRHADVLRVFRDPALHAGSGVTESFGAESGLLYDVMQCWLMSLDGGEHLRARGLVSREFTPRRVAALEPAVRE